MILHYVSFYSPPHRHFLYLISLLLSMYSIIFPYFFLCLTFSLQLHSHIPLTLSPFHHLYFFFFWTHTIHCSIECHICCILLCRKGIEIHLALDPHPICFLKYLQHAFFIYIQYQNIYKLLLYPITIFLYTHGIPCIYIFFLYDLHKYEENVLIGYIFSFLSFIQKL